MGILQVLLRAFTLLLSYICEYYVPWVLSNWRKHGVHWVLPHYPFDLFKPIEPFNTSLRKLYNDLSPHEYVGTTNLFTRELIVRDPKLIKNILRTDFDHFVDNQPFDVAHGDSIAGKFLTNMEGETWREVRKVVNRGFGAGKIKGMFGAMDQCCKEMVHFIEKQHVFMDQPIEAKLLFRRLTLEIVSLYAFGIKLDTFTTLNDEFAMMGSRFQNFSLQAMQNSVGFRVFLQVMQLLGIPLFDKTAVGFFTEKIKSKMAERDSKINEEKTNDFLQHLMDVKEDVKETKSFIESVLTDEVLIAQCLSVFLAGSDTTANVLMYSCYELAKNTQIQDALYDEIQRVGSDELTFDSIRKSEMPYLEMVIHETLRMYPALPRIDRKCTKPYTIPGSKVQINVGELIMIPIVGLHYDPSIYPNPDSFEPERFSSLPDTTTGISYLPFGSGPRQCLGMTFAMLELKVALVRLLQKFEIEIDLRKMPAVFEQAENTFAQKPKSGMWLKFNTRRH